MQQMQQLKSVQQESDADHPRRCAASKHFLFFREDQQIAVRASAIGFITIANPHDQDTQRTGKTN
jgi:hypothetical protein